MPTFTMQVDVKVSPNPKYCSVGTALGTDEIPKDKLDAYHKRLTEMAEEYSRQALAVVTDGETTPQKGSTTPQTSSEARDNWKYAPSPDGQRTIRWLPTSTVSEKAVFAQAASYLEDVGEDVDQWWVNDDREGEYSLAGGYKRWAPVALKPKPSHPLHDAMQREKTNGEGTYTGAAHYGSFTDDGELEFHSSKMWDEASAEETFAANEPTHPNNDGGDVPF